MCGVGAVELVSRARQSRALGSCSLGAASAWVGLAAVAVNAVALLWELVRMDFLTLRGSAGRNLSRAIGVYPGGGRAAVPCFDAFSPVQFSDPATRQASHTGFLRRSGGTGLLLAKPV